MILLQAVAASIVLSLLFGGKLSRLSDLTIRYGWLGLLAVVLQLVIIYADLPDALGPLGLHMVSMLITYGLLIVMVLANISLPGFGWIGLGMILNMTVIMANDGWMPISLSTLERAGLGHLVVVRGTGAYVLGSKDVVLAHAEANLWMLGDVFVCRPLHAAFSIGDVMLATGAFWFFWQQMRTTANANNALIDS